MIIIKPLTGISFEKIFTAFQNAFSDYVEPFDITSDQLKYMIERRGCDFDLSVGAFEGDELVGLTLNGVGEWNGRLTAYDTGTGVVKEYRKRGIATKMFNESLPILKEHNIRQYLLEVICSNTSAYDLYKKAGFEVVREFDYYISPKAELQINLIGSLNEYVIEEIDDPDWELLKTFWDFEPSWQNSIDSLKRKIDYFKIVGIFKDGNLLGYGIIEKSTGDIPQFAIAHKYRRQGLATILFESLINSTDTESIKIVNTDAHYDAFKSFARSINLQPGLGQYEMIMNI